MWSALLIWCFAGLTTDDALTLRTVVEADGARRSEGRYRVFENRSAQAGRTLDLQVVVLHAREDPLPDPVFVLAGGPGQNAAALWRGSQNSWMRQRRDLVFVSQRGTAGAHRLQLGEVGSDDDLQGYLEPLFEVAACRRSLERLQQGADLTQYSTPNAMDDVDDVRAALGYDQINLTGGSYGTRAALVYVRRHRDHVRSVILDGVAPLSFKNPLYHAASAQLGLERVFEEVERSRRLRAIFPDLRAKFTQILDRLGEQPATVTIAHPATRAPTEVVLTRDAFAEALRTLLYYEAGNRSVPLLLQRAWEGDLTPFAERGLQVSRSLRNQLALGMLLCVTAAEDVARIRDDEIDRLTAETFLGDRRVRAQRAVCDIWPKSTLPAGFADPVVADVPTLILSGTHDPVTPPLFGDVVAQQFPNSVHVVVHGCHGVARTIGSIVRDFLNSASVEGLDVSSARRVRIRAFDLPAVRGPF